MTTVARVALLLVFAAVVWAQETAAVAPAEGEQNWNMNLDIRNRWVQDVGGNNDVYRSIVNLGEGPRLFGGDIRFRDSAGTWIDELEANANAWGGDPYNTARVRLGLRDVYDLTFNYRNVAYFNNLPSFANPLLGEGLLLSQRALDITRRQIEADLVIRPNATVSPFFSFYDAQGFGLGTNDVPNRWRRVSGGDRP